MYYLLHNKYNFNDMVYFNNINDLYNNIDKNNIKYLSISNESLEEIPDISFLTNIEIIDCYENNLSKLPKLPDNLTSINCYTNNLIKLPNLSNFINLRFLNCGYNRLTELPDLSCLINLTKLYCHGNELTKLPKLSKCIKLKQLVCNNNKLTKLPNLNKCVDLLLIYCNYNKLIELPNLTKLKKLINIQCSNNLFTTIPLNILECKKLKYSKKYNKYNFENEYINELSYLLNCNIEKYYYSGIISYYKIKMWKY